MTAAGPEVAEGSTGWQRHFALPRFDFCRTPGHAVDAAEFTQGVVVAPAMAPPRSSQPLGLCGRPLCSGQDHEAELNVLRLPRCGQWTGQCTAIQLDSVDTELTLSCEQSSSSRSSGSSGGVLSRNLQTAKGVIRDVFAELESQCIQERGQWEHAGATAARPKSNVWATYTSRSQLQHFSCEALDFVRTHAECRARLLTVPQLRFLILLQHLISEDTNDFARPELQRRHQDLFEGILTDGVNSQLVKDAHRSEFSVEGRPFSLQDLHSLGDVPDAEKRRVIAEFQTEFIAFLESYLLAFCARRGLSPLGTRRLIQAVTTQMSQAGLANLDRGSQAARYFVGSQGLDQRTAYNLSTMQSAEHGECLKLSILCMKTGFTQFLERDNILKTSGVDAPKHCKPSSYLYQYATLRFSLGQPADSHECPACTLLDALDEARIDQVPDPVDP